MRKLLIHEVVELRDQYGGDMTLNRLVELIQGGKNHMCPKCGGRGMVSVKYNAYPNNLPDSMFVEKWAYKDIPCDLCNGEGYTEIEYRPRMVQDGWEKVN